MATTAITGKSCTFEYGASTSGTAQITTATIDEAASSETIQTLGGSVAISQGVESTVSAEFLYDGDAAAGSFYAALKAAIDGGTVGTLVITGGVGAASAPEWTGEALVTSLSAEMPADGAVTCSAEFAISGTFPFTPGA